MKSLRLLRDFEIKKRFRQAPLFMILVVLPLLINSCIDKQDITNPTDTMGSLYITSVPKGAQIFIMGTNTEQTTPDSVTGLVPGTYQVTLKNAGYQDTTFNVDVASKVKSTKTVVLKSTKGGGNGGTLVVFSFPAGAQIFENNVNTGKQTPDSLTGLINVNLNLTLKLQGYRDTTLSVNVPEDARIIKNIALTTKTQQPGPYGIINSTPQGAAIYFNNVATGMKTPDTLTNLSNGNYQVTLKLQGYNDTTFTLTIANNQNVTKNITLVRTVVIVPKKGSIYLVSNPLGAQIYLAGSNTGKSTPDSLTNLENGNYSITLKKSGYYDTTFSVNISNHADLTRNITLSRIVIPPPKKGSIFITSNPQHAAIYLQGSNTGKVTPDTLTSLDNGNYSVTLKLQGYNDTTITVSITNAQDVTRNVTLTKIPPPPPPKKGVIVLSSEPAGAGIYVDGNNTGKVTPDSLTNLEDGTYSIRLRHGGYQDTTFTTTITNASRNVFIIRLEDNLPPVNVSVDHYKTSIGQLVFTFSFDQDVYLDKVDVTDPNSGNVSTLNFNGTLVKKNEKKGILLLLAGDGNWTLVFYGRKAHGTQGAFQITKVEKVGD